MVGAQKILSPRSYSGSFLFSILVHATLVIGTAWVLGLKPSAKIDDSYVDLDYQTLDEPPGPTQERHVRAPEEKVPVEKTAKVDNSPHEMQDEKGDVTGTQKEAKQAANTGSGAAGSGEAAPYYKIKPKYPVAALQAGTEGWVLFLIDIKEDGTVDNIRVIDGEQRNTFQAEARRALSQWKYKPFVDSDGKPFLKKDHQVRVDFKLTDVVVN